MSLWIALLVPQTSKVQLVLDLYAVTQELATAYLVVMDVVPSQLLGL